MSLTTPQLEEEAKFADTAYAQFANDVRLNVAFYNKYAKPRSDWDWRQYGARLLGDVRERKLLDYGCGQGEEAVYLAKMGAYVTAIDISNVGVELTRKRAECNGVGKRVHATVMRCDPTTFPSSSFDIVHGFGILHHVGLREGLTEVKRILKSPGKGIFFEHMGNIDFIEWIKPDDRCTTNERPLKWRDVLAHRGDFRRFTVKPFHLITRLRRRIPLLDRDVLRKIDYAALSVFPALRYFASGIVIYLET